MNENNVPKFEILEVANSAGFQIIEIQEGEFEGIDFNFSQVRIEEENDVGRMRFDYTVVSGEVSEDETSRFVKVIGDILISILSDQMNKPLGAQTVVYAGGVGAEAQ
jgi:tRNA A37 threonylcarbamoyltransferase TsaD